MIKSKHLIEPNDLDLLELEEVFRLADTIMSYPRNYLDLCKGKLLASLFFEPSTRTKFSFESAMLRLGGQIIGFDNPDNSSTTKGESLEDTIRTISCYADIAVIRHPQEGTARLASKYAGAMSVINAGDGDHQHPTQTLTDLFTIKKMRGSISDFTIGICGDLKYGRTVHSLVKALNRYENIKFIFISPEELKLPLYVKEELTSENYEEYKDLESVIEKLDILYMTRVQRERFESEYEYQKLKDYFILDSKKVNKGKKDMMVMHPLPRVNEISAEVDDDPRAVYFTQAKYGMFVRMALIVELLGLN